MDAPRSNSLFNYSKNICWTLLCARQCAKLTRCYVKGSNCQAKEVGLYSIDSGNSRFFKIKRNKTKVSPLF